MISKTLIKFLIVVAVSLIPLFILDIMVLSENDIYNYYISILNSDSIDKIIESWKKWRWISYPISIIFIFIKTLLVTSIIWIVVFISSHKKTFNEIWGITIWAQLVFAIKNYLLLAIAIFSPEFSLTDLQNFHPLSLASIFERDTLPSYWLFIFQSLNLFEILYWFTLAFLLSKLIKKNLNDGLKLTLSSYVPAFVLWLLAVTFFLITNS